ncbi:DNA-processing protein DprA [Anaerolentibacter hominis]|uniref:DNA-processing protein DprA n=1 Tax=Anaerolentibacter hominis TaxID=3079009 RepID=UPI0031B8776E
MEREEYWLWLGSLEGIGNRKRHRLLEWFHTPERIYMAQEKELLPVPGLTERDRAVLLRSGRNGETARILEEMEKKEISLLTLEDGRYPAGLKEICDCPVCFYYKGNLPEDDKPSLAVVGARNCTNYGRTIAEEFAEELASCQVQIISGLARGIDAAAHRGALNGNGYTCGVLGCGADICYPAQNQDLYQEMETRGGIISEFPPGTPPLACHFPMRNRIISGLCDGILIVEARRKSGSLITADMALEQGRDVFAIPGRITDLLSEGCNNLIKMGAEPVGSPVDILNSLTMEKYGFEKDCRLGEESTGQMFLSTKGVEKKIMKNELILDSKEEMVYACLDLLPKSVQDVVDETGMEVYDVMQSLLSLELKNYIRQTAGSKYVKERG